MPILPSIPSKKPPNIRDHVRDTLSAYAFLLRDNKKKKKRMFFTTALFCDRQVMVLLVRTAVLEPFNMFN